MRAYTLTVKMSDFERVHAQLSARKVEFLGMYPKAGLFLIKTPVKKLANIRKIDGVLQVTTGPMQSD